MELNLIYKYASLLAGGALLVSPSGATPRPPTAQPQRYSITVSQPHRSWFSINSILHSVFSIITAVPLPVISATKFCTVSQLAIFSTVHRTATR
jgi:hypothetical protein